MNLFFFFKSGYSLVYPGFDDLDLTILNDDFKRKFSYLNVDWLVYINLNLQIMTTV